MRMATLLHLTPSFSPFSSNNDYNHFNIYKTKLFFLNNTNNNNDNNIHSSSNKTEYRPYRCHCPISASSTNKSSRVRKKAVRSNEEICNEIRLFLSDLNLPHDHFPSFKLLSDNGRQELANIVRRRGYKLLKELLSTSVETNTTENGSTEEQDNVVQHESTGQVKELPDLSIEAPIIKDDSSIIDSDSEFNLGESKCISSVSSLQEKVAIFIQRGELNMMKNSFDIINEDVSKEDDGFFESENSTIIFSNSAMEEQNILSQPGSGGDVLLSQQVIPNVTSRNNYVYTDGLSSSDSNNDLDVEARKKDNEVEISRLRFMLHRKELELSDLKKQIEKEKIALSVLQAKAEAEISNAQKLVSDKDAELLAAEESLSELEEVQIQFWDDGESVELAGSFNGWQQRIKMEPQPVSSVMDSDSIQSRKPRLWRTVLWLYPGIYEIKFIVDGHWKIDPERESVTKGTIHNNILRINR